MPETTSTIEPTAYLASSVYYAIKRASESAQEPLHALYALHRKWREAANYSDNQQSVTTLNWWHDELQTEKKAPSEQPALRALQSQGQYANYAETLQYLLHGHMHWHHLNRIETLAQLQPTIDAIGGQFARVWMLICGAQVPEALIQSAGRTLWWIDQTRHIGHTLSQQRQWLPMQWLKDADTPSHIVLQTQLSPQERAKNMSALTTRLIAQAQAEWAEYQSQYERLPHEQRTAIRSWHTLINLRADLLTTIAHEPAELFEGLVSIAPIRKWWRVVRM